MKSIILAGGSVTRLFPLSRKKFPKQFLSFGEKETLFQKTTHPWGQVLNLSFLPAREGRLGVVS